MQNNGTEIENSKEKDMFLSILEPQYMDMAQVIFNANCGVRAALGEPFELWRSLSQDFKNHLVDLIKHIVDNTANAKYGNYSQKYLADGVIEKTMQEDLHNYWMGYKLKQGWGYGEVSDPIEKKDPLLLPYDQLPIEQKFKHDLFCDIVRTYMAAAAKTTEEIRNKELQELKHKATFEKTAADKVSISKALGLSGEGPNQLAFRKPELGFKLSSAPYPDGAAAVLTGYDKSEYKVEGNKLILNPYDHSGLEEVKVLGLKEEKSLYLTLPDRDEQAKDTQISVSPSINIKASVDSIEELSKENPFD